jgi:hypothetical protein
VKLMDHQVTSGEYHYRSDPNGVAGDDQPVTWVTQPDAAKFCAAIGAHLPSFAEWTRAASGSWGLDPAGKGVIGPLEEWTSTVEGGYATVAGAYAGMSDDDRQLAIEAPMQKALAGTREETASAKVGFRCAR